MRNYFTWPLTVYFYLPTLQREGRRERRGMEGEKEKERDGETKRETENKIRTGHI